MELLGNASVNVNREIILPPFLSSPVHANTIGIAPARGATDIDGLGSCLPGTISVALDASRQGVFLLCIILLHAGLMLIDFQTNSSACLFYEKLSPSITVSATWCREQPQTIRGLISFRVATSMLPHHLEPLMVTSHIFRPRNGMTRGAYPHWAACGV
jgi:hypothetical protein